MTTTVSRRAKEVGVGGVLLQLLPWALLGLLFAAVGILHVASRVLVVDAGYQLSRLEQEGQKLALANSKLKVELALLKSPARLEKVAREQLGMGPVPAGAMVALQRDPARAEPGRSSDRAARANRASARRAIDPDVDVAALSNVRSPNG